MARLDRVPKPERVMRALRSGDMTSGELARRLRVRDTTDALKRLERAGRVRLIGPDRVQGEWTCRTQALPELVEVGMLAGPDPLACARARRWRERQRRLKLLTSGDSDGINDNSRQGR